MCGNFLIYAVKMVEQRLLSIYLFFLLLLGFPIIMCEFAVGRASGVGTGMCFDKLEPKGGRWHRFKWGAIGGSYILMMFYTMVGGWMLYYAYKMATGQLSGLSKDKDQRSV